MVLSPEGGRSSRLRRVVLERLIRYYRYLAEVTAKEPVSTITSAQIAEALDVDPTQVRKDFSAIGLVGIGRVGFDVCEACRAIRVGLGFDQTFEAVLLGCGHLGSALMAYSGFAAGFAQYGLRIVAAFDNDDRKIGRTIAGMTVRPMKGLTPYVRRHEIRLAIITVPAEVAQKMTDRLVAAGVTAIWNFAPTQLSVPAGVLVRNEHISRGLSEIAYHLKR
jgi:redox-sensing transcriptional repressor